MSLFWETIATIRRCARWRPKVPLRCTAARDGEDWQSQVNSVVGAYADRDVVLLDSRCLVGDGWLDRLIAHAYSGLNIATVTPLTTMGGMQSENPIDAGLAIPSLSNVASAAQSVMRREQRPGRWSCHWQGGFAPTCGRDSIDRAGGLFTDKDSGGDLGRATIGFSARAEQGRLAACSGRRHSDRLSGRYPGIKFSHRAGTGVVQGSRSRRRYGASRAVLRNGRSCDASPVFCNRRTLPDKRPPRHIGRVP